MPQVHLDPPFGTWVPTQDHRATLQVPPRCLAVISVPVLPVSRTTLSQLSSLGGAVIPGSPADLQGLGRLPSAELFNLLPAV